MAIIVKGNGSSTKLSEEKMLENVSENRMRAAFEEAVEMAKKEWVRVIEAKGHVETGDMRDSVGISKEGIRKSGEGWYAEVYPQGKDRNGQSNAEKAFRLHYGWKKGQKRKKSSKGSKGAHTGDHFVDEVNGTVQVRFLEIINEKIMEGL